MMAAGLFVADTDEAAERLRSSQLLAFARLRSGRPGLLPAPVDDVARHVPPEALAQAAAALSVSATGSPATARQQLAQIVERWRPDELIVTGMIFDPEARRRSLTLGAAILGEIGARAAA